MRKHKEKSQACRHVIEISLGLDLHINFNFDLLDITQRIFWKLLRQ
jgi:hypothetical protein